MEQRFVLKFSNGHTAKALKAEDEDELASIVDQLGLQRPVPVLVLIGGAGKLSRSDLIKVRSLFVKVLAPLAEVLGATVVDGGTDSGIMRMMGRARQKTRSGFPLVGVAPIGVVTLPDQPPPDPDSAPLEPNHTHFILTPGNAWGDESVWLAHTASVIAGDEPSITVLINGGEVTWADASEAVREGRPLIAIAGSGRTADILATSLEGKFTDERARRIVASGLLKSIDLRNSDDLARVIWESLSK